MQPQMPYGGPPQGQYPNGQPPPTQYPGQPPVPPYQPPPGYQQTGHPAPLPPPPPEQKTPYDFFMRQKSAAKKKPLLPSPQKLSLRGKLVYAIGGLVGLILVFSFVNALLPKDTTSLELTAIAQTQQEVIRVCGLGASKAKYQVTRNFAINCSTGTLTDQKALIAYLAERDVKVSGKQLSLSANASIDQQLKTAASASTYDDTFKTISEKQLTAYASLLNKQLISPSLGPVARELLTASLDHAKLLIEQVQLQSNDTTEAAPATEE